MDAYNAAEKAGANALGYALECGKHLNAAKADVGNGKWKKWCGEKLKVSEETERASIADLLKPSRKKPDVFAACKSIRKAMEELAKYNLKDMTLKPPRPKGPSPAQSGNTVTGLVPPEPDTRSTGLKAELENAGADEIIVNIDADKLEEVAKASIAKLSPDKICAAIVGTFSVSQIIDLTKRLNDHVQKQPRTTPVNLAQAADLHRRPLPHATQ
jgi:hypothetical protein